MGGLEQELRHNDREETVTLDQPVRYGVAEIWPAYDSGANTKLHRPIPETTRRHKTFYLAPIG
jgi:hypothetical protein